MDNLKTVLFFILGLAGLVVVSVLLTGRMEADIRPLPTATPTIQPTPTATPTAAAQAGCQPTSGGVAYGYLPGAPLTTTLAPPELPGERLVITGTVFASDCVTPLPNTLVEVWHADAAGRYDRSEPFILRGQIRTDADGRYEFSTIRPGHYETGELTRPAHIHYRVSYEDHDPVGTRLLFADDPYLVGSSVDPTLLTSLSQEPGPNGTMLRGIFDIILPVVPPTPDPKTLEDPDL